MGDLLTITSSAGPWWTAVNDRGQQGYVPSNFVVPFDSLDRHEWYHGRLRRLEAENMLREQNIGTYLIRDSESKPGTFTRLDHTRSYYESICSYAIILTHMYLLGYSLSVRDANMVKHYRVKVNPEGKQHITRQAMFDSIGALVEHYTQVSDGLCYRLTRPCPKPAQGTLELDYRTAHNWEVDRSTIQLLRLLGKGEFGEVYYGKWSDGQDSDAGVEGVFHMSCGELGFY